MFFKERLAILVEEMSDDLTVVVVVLHPKQIDNLEELLKEKDNQFDMTRSRLTKIQAHHSTSEGTLTSMEDAINDKEKQIALMRDQRDRAEHERNEDRIIHERQLAEYKMKLHSLESEMVKLQVNHTT